MGSYAPDHVVAQVRALVLQGYRPKTIERMTGVADTNVHRWLAEWEQLGTEVDKEIFNQEKRVSLLAGELLQIKYESAINDPDSVSLSQAAIGYGISRSKEHERAQRQSPSGGIQVNIAIVGSDVARTEPHAEIELAPTHVETKHDDVTSTDAT